MTRYILKRLLLLVPVVLGVIVIVFTILYFTPGDYAQIAAGANATQEAVDQIKAKLGTDKSYFVQLFNYIKNLVLRFDLGTSYTTYRSVTEEIITRFPTTMKVGLCAVFVSVTLGLICGIISAIRQYSVFDYACQVLGLTGMSIPGFWLALVLILLFSVELGWFPSSGLNQGLKSYVLPALACGLQSSATIMRMTRSSMLDVVSQDYITTARAKGQREFFVITRHALKNALIPILTVVGMQFGGMLGGTVIIETCFSIAGMGTLSVTAINNRNVPIVMGVVLMLSIVHCVVNLIVDILYSFVDPRIRTQYARPSKQKKAKTASQAEV